MSETLDAPRQWRFYAADMIECCRKVISYTRDLKSQTAFVRDSRTYDATLRNLELVGEAATHIPQGVRKAHPEIA